MDWEFEEITHQIASKDYDCQAMPWIFNSGLDEGDFEPEHWDAIQKAKSEGCKIKKGEKYLKVRGKWEGEWATYRARKEIDEICQYYDLYQY
jgi:hypothetical protein